MKTQKFQGILFCTDLDGTLIGSDGTISKENREAIRYFQSEGGIFTFITGRPPLTAHALCENILPNAPIGCLNGGGIYDFREERMLYAAYLDDGVDEMLDAVEREMPDVGILVNAPEGVFFSHPSESSDAFCKRRALAMANRSREEIARPFYKIVFLHCDGARIEALAELLHSHPLTDRYSYIRSEYELYEILPKGSCKGEGLRRLAAHLGIPMERTIAIGDYNNDVSMIRAAHLGVAVANAVPEAKAAADLVTVSNDESAIAAVISALDRGEIAL